MKVIYKITYPNGKIYIGLDLTNTLLTTSEVPTASSLNKILPGNNNETLLSGKKYLKSFPTLLTMVKFIAVKLPLLLNTAQMIRRGVIIGTLNLECKGYL